MTKDIIRDLNPDDFIWDDTIGWMMKRPLTDYIQPLPESDKAKSVSEVILN